MTARLLASTLVFLVLVPACDDGTIEPPPTTQWDLEDGWSVRFIRWDDIPIDTTDVFISQSDASVLFLDVMLGRTDTIATGEIVADTIMCSDMYNVGISKIFIDHDRHMHSETPAVDNDLKYLEFVR
jgi:hypothetical protein